jgi:hypothetical protein
MKLSYCDLLPNDPPYLDLKAAIILRNPQLAATIRQEIEVWPYAQKTKGGEFPTCFHQAWPSLGEVTRAPVLKEEEEEESSAGEVLVVLGLISLMLV